MFHKWILLEDCRRKACKIFHQWILLEDCRCKTCRIFHQWILLNVTNAENLDSHCLIKVLTLSAVQCSHASVQQGITPGAVRRYAPIPPMPVWSKNRGGSTSIRGQVHSPHISGGRWWLSCRQPTCLYPRQLHRGTDRQTDRSRYSLGQGIKIDTLAKQFNVTMLKNSQMSTESHLL